MSRFARMSGRARREGGGTDKRRGPTAAPDAIGMALLRRECFTSRRSAKGSAAVPKPRLSCLGWPGDLCQPRPRPILGKVGGEMGFWFVVLARAIGDRHCGSSFPHLSRTGGDQATPGAFVPYRRTQGRPPPRKTILSDTRLAEMVTEHNTVPPPATPRRGFWFQSRFRGCTRLRKRDDWVLISAFPPC
jgi:hypothetical protein